MIRLVPGGGRRPAAPQIAASTWQALLYYCGSNGLNPHKVRWLRTTHHLNGLRGEVILVISSTPFQPEFDSLLHNLRENRLIVVEAVRLP